MLIVFIYIYNYATYIIVIKTNLKTYQRNCCAFFKLIKLKKIAI